MRNYDTRGHKTYPRVTKLEITYDRAGRPSAEYIEQTAIVDGDGNVQHINASETRHTLDFSLITEPVQLVNPVTGDAIPGQFTTSQQVMLGLLAFLRAGQKRRDAEQDAATAA